MFNINIDLLNDYKIKHKAFLGVFKTGTQYQTIYFFFLFVERKLCFCKF